MTPNNNLSPLAFYDSVDKQNHRKDYAFGEAYPLYTPSRRILPFQIIRSTRAIAAIPYAALHNLDGSVFLDITAPMISGGLEVVSHSSLGFDVIKYPDPAVMAITTPEGQYYLEIYDGTQRWYSEVFIIVDQVYSYLQIEYGSSDTLFFSDGALDFADDFKFRVYLPTQLGRPEYPFTEDIQEREGYTFTEKQISEKTFKFNFLAPEFLLDALRLVRMMDSIRIRNKGEVYQASTFLLTPRWEDGGFVASVEAEFQCDTVVKKTGSIGELPVFPAGIGTAIIGDTFIIS